MKRPGRVFLLSLTLVVAILAAPLADEAQPSTNIPGSDSSRLFPCP